MVCASRERGRGRGRNSIRLIVIVLVLVLVLGRGPMQTLEDAWFLAGMQIPLEAPGSLMLKTALTGVHHAHVGLITGLDGLIVVSGAPGLNDR